MNAALSIIGSSVHKESVVEFHKHSARLSSCRYLDSSAIRDAKQHMEDWEWDRWDCNRVIRKTRMLESHLKETKGWRESSCYNLYKW